MENAILCKSTEEKSTKKTAGKKIHLVKLGGKRKMVPCEEKREIQGWFCKPYACLYKEDLYLNLPFYLLVKEKGYKYSPRKQNNHSSLLKYVTSDEYRRTVTKLLYSCTTSMPSAATLRSLQRSTGWNFTPGITVELEQSHNQRRRHLEVQSLTLSAIAEIQSKPACWTWPLNWQLRTINTAASWLPHSTHVPSQHPLDSSRVKSSTNELRLSSCCIRLTRGNK